MLSLLGRDDELAIIGRAFDENQARLVTLAGPGGIGKSAVARAYAARRQQQLGQASSYFVVTNAGEDLADQIVRAIPPDRAVVADLTIESRIDRAVAILNALGGGDGPALLLVIDSVEKPPSIETIRTLLDRCPDLAILLTSREVLGGRASSGSASSENEDEYVLRLAPLTREPALRLLCRAAERASLAFKSGAEDQSLLIEIATTLLEGVPLALEIAGARLPMVGARGLADELRARDRAGIIDVAVRGSYEALTEADRRVLAELTVFRGGFTLEAARAVVAAGASEGADDNAAKAVERLFACSLVRLAADNRPGRFDLYAHVREFVLRHADTSSTKQQMAAAADRHTTFFEEATQNPSTSREWIVAERDNVLEIIRRLLPPSTESTPTSRGAEMAIRVLLALSTASPSGEVLELVSPLVERTRDSGADPKLTARAMLLRGAVRREVKGDVRASLKDLLAAESIARAIRDDHLIADALIELGKTLRCAGELDAARQNFDRASRMNESPHTIALTAATAGEAGDLQAALALASRAVALAAGRGADLQYVLARTHAELGDHASALTAVASASSSAPSQDPWRAALLRGLIHHDQGDLDSAANAFALARDEAASRGLSVDAAIARGHLGALSRERGDFANAYALLADARAECTRAKRHRHAALFTAHLAAIESSLGREEAARELLLTTNATAGRMGSAAPLLIECGIWPVEVDAWKRRGLHGRIFTRCSAAAAATSTSTLEAALPDDVLVIGKDGSWFRPPVSLVTGGGAGSSRVGLERRKSLALLLHQLASVHQERQQRTLRAIDLFEAAWPGEKAIASAAAHRVRVAIATLRKMGLRDALVTTPDGYALDPAIPVVIAT